MAARIAVLREEPPVVVRRVKDDDRAVLVRPVDQLLQIVVAESFQVGFGKRVLVNLLLT